MTKNEIYKKLSEDFPPEAMTKDNSRGFALTSIKAQYVRERLNEVLGVDGWATFAEVVSDTEQGVAVKLKMTILVDGKEVTRTAFGGAARKGKSQTYGDVYKSAETDALSKAASNFGVGNSVFKGLVDANSLSKGKIMPLKKKTTSKSSFGAQAQDDDF